MEHSQIVKAMMEPSFYGHPVQGVVYIQTHISSVFLTGDYAYKLKKPVNFGFLDFSAVEKRREYCLAEVELNRRLAPAVYLGVAAVTHDGARLGLDGDGEVVDWVVVMRQMDTSRLGPAVLERGELRGELIDAVVDRLVPFYSEAATGPGIDEFGTVSSVKVNTDENFQQTEDFVDLALSRKRYDLIKEFNERFYSDNRELFDRRIREGRIRESHGDLHLGNIVFEKDGPVIFDCIEFNQRFRCGDVAVDLAFLAMDLEFRGKPELADRAIRRYVQASGDDELPLLMNFYRCYRAYVRGKIACFTASDPSLDEEGRQQQLDLARRYFRLAFNYAGGTVRPKLLVIYGLMGTGKTSLARYVGEELGWTVLGSDAIRKELAGIGHTTRVYVPYNEGLYSPEMNQRTYDEMCVRAERLLAAGMPVVMDGCFKDQPSRRPVIELAERCSAELCFVQTTCTVEEQRRRLEKRKDMDTCSDGRVELIQSQREDFEPPESRFAQLFQVLSTDTTRDETRARMKRFLVQRGMIPAS